MSPNDVIAIVVSGIVAGSLYALIASGLSLVWGTLRMLNLAHGALLMLGAYSTWWVSNEAGGLGLNIAVGIAVAVLMLTIGGVILYWLLVRPWIGRPRADLIVIITTLAAASFLQNGTQLIFGPRYKQLDRVATGTVQIGDTAIGLQDVVIIILAPTVLITLAILLRRTMIGLSIRAVEQNRDAALLVGIKVDRVYKVTFAVSAVLACLAGVLLGGLFFITPFMGNDPLLKAFIVVVFGGLGSLPGTVIGAYTIGLIESASNFFIGLFWTPVVLFSVLIVVMALRPTGLMGREA